MVVPWRVTVGQGESKSLGRWGERCWHHVGEHCGWGGQRWGSDTSHGLRNRVRGLVLLLLEGGLRPSGDDLWWPGGGLGQGMVLDGQEMASGDWKMLLGGQEMVLDDQYMVLVDQEVVLGIRRRFWVAKKGPSCPWCSPPWWACCRDLGTRGWGCTGALREDGTRTLALGIPVGGHHVCPPLGCGMQWPPPGTETLSTHGQWGPSPGCSMAEGMWVPPSPCRAPLNSPFPPQPRWCPPRQDERDGQHQPRQPRPLRLRHPGAPRRGPCQAARHGPRKHPRAPRPPQVSIPPAREGAGPRPQDPQAQRRWQSRGQGGQPWHSPPRGAETPGQSPSVPRQVARDRGQQEERGRQGGGAQRAAQSPPSAGQGWGPAWEVPREGYGGDGE